MATPALKSPSFAASPSPSERGHCPIPHVPALLEGLDTIACLLTPDLCLLSMTPAAARLLRLSVGDLGCRLPELVSRLGNDPLLGQLLPLLRLPGPHTTTLVWQGETYAIRMVTGILLEDATEGLVVQLHRSESLRLEEALRHRDRLLHLLTDALPIRLAYVDAARRCRYWAFRLDRWHGQGGLEPGGQPLAELLGEREYRLVEPYVGMALSGQQVTFQYELPGAAGRPRLLVATYVPHRDGNQRLLGFYALTSDLADASPLEARGTAVRTSAEGGRTRLLRLLHCIASVLYHARDLNEAIAFVLLQVSQQMGWCFAQAYRPPTPASDRLVPLESYYEAVPGKYRAFRQMLLQHQQRTGEGLAQRAYACGTVQWADDLPAEWTSAEPPLAPAPLPWTIALPVILGEQVVAVLEFFSPERCQLSGPVLSTLESIAALLAVVAEREQAAEESRQRELRVHAIVHAAADGILTVNENCHIESTNPAAERVFGYRTEEILGRDIALLIPLLARGDADLGTLVEQRAGKPLPACVETYGHRKVGTSFPIELSVSELRLADRRLFSCLVRDITERKRVEKQVLEMSTHEQRRIGHELYDGLGQELTGLSYLAKHLQQRLHEHQIPEAQSAADLVLGLQRAIGQVRSIAKGLVPAQIDARVLIPALHALGSSLQERYAVVCQVVCDPGVAVHTNHKAVHLYRIAQEASRNAVKHGRARQIRLSLSSQGPNLVLEICDDGLGLRTGGRRPLGLGMKIMQYRARLIGGTLEVRPLEAGGTQVLCLVPQDEPNE